MPNLTAIGTIKGILSRHNFNFSKSLGQNFLINSSVCPRMAELCGASSQVGVIEIGPGIGVLTAELARRAKKVVAIELDQRLIPVLGETLAKFDNVKVINDDVLKIDLHELIRREFEGMRVVVCANLPYYITTPIIMTLLEERLPIESITVMVQKEVAQRLCASPGTRQAGAVTIAVQYYSQPNIAFHVSRGSFLPAPKVDSSVIKLELREKPLVEVVDEKKFFALVKAAFAQRRKTLVNSLSGGLNLDKKDIVDGLKRADLPENARVEQLGMRELALLCDNLHNKFGG